VSSGTLQFHGQKSSSLLQAPNHNLLNAHQRAGVTKAEKKALGADLTMLLLICGLPCALCLLYQCLCGPGDVRDLSKRQESDDKSLPPSWYKVQQNLVNMGYSEEKASRALWRCKGQFEPALKLLVQDEHYHHRNLSLPSLPRKPCR